MDMFKIYFINISTYNAHIKQKAQKTYKMYDKVDFLFIRLGLLSTNNRIIKLILFFLRAKEGIFDVGI